MGGNKKKNEIEDVRLYCWKLNAYMKEVLEKVSLLESNSVSFIGTISEWWSGRHVHQRSHAKGG